MSRPVSVVIEVSGHAFAIDLYWSQRARIQGDSLTCAESGLMPMTTTVSRLCGQPTAADLLGIEIPPVPRCLCFLHLRGPHQSHFLSSIARLGENLRDCALLRL